MPENLWKLSVTYLFEDTDFPIGGLQPRFFKIYYIRHLQRWVEKSAKREKPELNTGTRPLPPRSTIVYIYHLVRTLFSKLLCAA